MPTALIVDKYRFFFFSHEGTEPIHIHIESADSYAKFWLEPIQLSKSVGYNAVELNKIRKIIFQNNLLLKEKWNEHFNR